MTSSLDTAASATTRGRRSGRLLAAVLVLGAAGTVFAIDRLRPDPVSPWQTEAVARADIEASVSAIGTLQPVSSVDVGAQVSGQITRIHVEPGAEVTKGQLLAEIDASVLAATVAAGEARIASLRAQLADARAQYQLAELQHQRQQRLDAAQATRLEDVQTAAATHQSAAARVDRFAAEIRETAASLQADQARLGYTRIYAPIDGVVTGVDVKQGQTLNATYQTPTVLRIADLSRMTVWTDVSEADIGQVKSGLPASFTTLGGTRRQWRGAVRQVLPAPPLTAAAAAPSGPGGAAAAGVKAVQYTVLFDVDNPDGVLKPQMTAQVKVVAAARRQVPSAPLAAFAQAANADHEGDHERDHERDHDGGWQARVLRADGSVETRRVRLGVRDRMRAEVLEGLKEGELVVTGEQVAEASPRRFRW